jgi:hypothetical protein
VASFLAPILLVHGAFATTDNHNAVIATGNCNAKSPKRIEAFTGFFGITV